MEPNSFTSHAWRMTLCFCFARLGGAKLKHLARAKNNKGWVPQAPLGGEELRSSTRRDSVKGSVTEKIVCRGVMMDLRGERCDLCVQCSPSKKPNSPWSALIPHFSMLYFLKFKTPTRVGSHIYKFKIPTPSTNCELCQHHESYLAAKHSLHSFFL